MVSEAERADTGAGTRPSERLKILLLLVLLGVFALIAVRVYEPSVVKWHLGTLRQDPTSAEAREGLRALGDRVYPYLRTELRSDDADSRFVVILALRALEGREAERLLREACDDPDPLNAINAVAALSDRGRGGATLQALSRLLGSEAPAMQFAARRLAGRVIGLPWWAYGPVREPEGGGG